MIYDRPKSTACFFRDRHIQCCLPNRQNALASQYTPDAHGSCVRDEYYWMIVLFLTASAKMCFGCDISEKAISYCSIYCCKRYTVIGIVLVPTTDDSFRRAVFRYFFNNEIIQFFSLKYSGFSYTGSAACCCFGICTPELFFPCLLHFALSHG